MYKVMLADDEGIVIDALKFIINKNFGDKCEIQYAKTGRSVIELAEQFRPDIAFMDIQMPGINGIEAMKEIKKSNSNIIFIVLSAYNKFDYAREAINLGVLEYVNKPIEQKTIVGLMEKAIKITDTKRERRSSDLKNKEKLEIVGPIIESGLIYSVVFQENYAEDIHNYMDLLGIKEEHGYIMVIQCSEPREEGRSNDAVNASVKAQSYYKELREIVKGYFHCAIGNMMVNNIIIYVPCEEAKENEYRDRIHTMETASKLLREIKRRFDLKFRIGIGSVKSISEAGESYEEAVNTLRYTSSSVSHVGDFPLRCGYEEDYPIEVEKALFEAIEQGDAAKAIANGNTFFNWMVTQHREHLMDIKLKILEFVLHSERIAYSNGGQTYTFCSRSGYFEKLYFMGSYEELRSWFITKIQVVSTQIATKKEKTNTYTIEKAKVYIMDNFMKEITLDDVSEAVNISPYYFSKLFKKEMGVNFIDYLTNIRMEKAKELLGVKDMSIKQICSEVGYSDPNYFSRIFKKNVGKTPTEFKEGR